ncbi:MAG: tetratricopeptide repeat protein [Sphingomicrobium sp.]
MNFRPTIVALALATAAIGVAPASAQYGAPPPQQQQQQIQPPAPTQAPQRTPNISRRASKALTELQDAVNASDVATITAKLAAAQAAAQSSDEKYFVAQLQLKAAAAAKNQAAMAAAVEAMLASGGVEQSNRGPLYVELGNIHLQAKQHAQAAAALERAIGLNSNNAEALALLGETRNAQGRSNEAVALLQRALKAKLAGGQKPDESWYKRAIAIAYQAQMPSSMELSRQWVAAYPSPASWRDALRIYRKVGKPDEATTLDTLRLARAAGALEGDGDFHVYAFAASNTAAVGEARAVIDEAIAAKHIDPAKPLFKDIIATLRADRSMSREALPELAKNALADPAARLAVRTADALYGYGEYAKAAELYRATLTKTGADSSLVNLHLGMALARAGDKAGATAALNAVTGPRAELAKYWLMYVATRT